MISLDIRGLPEVRRLLRNLAEDQLPFAISSALNSTAFAVQKAQKERMPSVFDRPTPLIKGAFRVEKSTKQTLTAKVFVEPRRAIVLSTHERGGSRGLQRIERYLRGKGWLPSGYRATPTDKMPRNSYGNPRQAMITKIMQVLDGGSSQQRYFVIPPGSASRLSPGVYRANKTGLVKLYHFVGRVSYDQRLEFAETSEAEARRLLPNQMSKAIARAIATAR